MTDTIDKGNDTWKVMNDLNDAFSHIGDIEFLVDELQKAIDKNDWTAVVDITAALTAYLPVFTAQYDRAQDIAWTQVVGQPDLTYDPVSRFRDSRTVPIINAPSQSPLTEVRKLPDNGISEEPDLYLGEEWQ